MKIDKDIPVTFPGRRKYPFIEMEIGDSIQVEEDEFVNASMAARNFGKRTNRKFTARKDQKRIWRIG